jgi:uncharacterized protein
MTPQERELVDGLFDRLAQLESAPRDADAERLIVDGLRRAPHAVYALVQTTLLQDEALKRANARIEELQAQTGSAEPPPQRPASFLDSMREALGGRAPRGSVPSVRTAGGYQSQNFQQQGPQPQAGYPPQVQPGYPGAPGFGTGGSFLGTAASAAAGYIGGALLLDSIRSMFGHHAGMAGASAFGLGDDRPTFADRVQDRRQDLADDDREQDAEQDLADEDAEQDSEQDMAEDDDFGGGDDGYDA